MGFSYGDTKQYQKTSSRSASSHDTEQRTISQQTIRYLIANPLATNYIIKQETYATGDNSTIHAELQYSN